MMPLADIVPLALLLLYGLAIVGVLVLAKARLRASEPMHGELPDHAPGAVDPYEVAYLRGGPNEVARVVIVSLVERQILELKRPGSGPLSGFAGDTKYIGRRASDPRPALSPIEATVYEWFAESRSTADVFRASLPDLLRPYCLAFEERLQQQRLLRRDGDASRQSVVGAGVMAMGAIAALPVITPAAEPTALVIAMAIAGTIALLLLTVRKRVTVRGRKYLTALRARLPHVPADAPYTLTAAVAGTAALAATPLSDLGAEFKKSQQAHAASGAAGCGGWWGGGGCGSGCGGAGGCGGGGGGCGGGGCGGG
jgi:uncharacterized protein (TIGR04222 family)